MSTTITSTDTTTITTEPRRATAKEKADGPSDAADIIAVYFDPNTLSPITLLELGLHAASGKLIVCCPDGFWRKGNVRIVCERFNIPLFNDYNSWLAEIKIQLEE